MNRQEREHEQKLEAAHRNLKPEDYHPFELDEGAAFGDHKPCALCQRPEANARHHAPPGNGA